MPLPGELSSEGEPRVHQEYPLCARDRASCVSYGCERVGRWEKTALAFARTRRRGSRMTRRMTRAASAFVGWRWRGVCGLPWYDCRPKLGLHADHPAWGGYGMHIRARPPGLPDRWGPFGVPSGSCGDLYMCTRVHLGCRLFTPVALFTGVADSSRRGASALFGLASALAVVRALSRASA